MDNVVETPLMDPKVTGEPEAVAALAGKILRVASGVRGVEKSGRNNFHKYDYVTENDLLNAVVPGLEDEGVMVVTSTTSQMVVETKTKKGDTEFLTLVTTAHTFIDGENGAQITVYSQGQGSDKGDKGVYKAITGANKYFLYKSFLKAAGDDPEGDASVDKRRNGNGRSRSQKARRTNGGGSPSKKRKQRKPKQKAESKFVSPQKQKELLKRAKQEFGLSVKDVGEILSGIGIESTSKIPKAKAGEVWNAIQKSQE